MSYPTPAPISPNHVLLADFTVIDDADSVTGAWELVSQDLSTLTLDDTYVTDLSTSIRLDWDVASGAAEDDGIELHYALPGSIDLTHMKTIGLLLYIEGDEDVMDIFTYDGIVIRLVTTTANWFNDSRQWNFHRGGQATTSVQQPGWCWLTAYADDWRQESGTFDITDVNRLSMTLNSDASAYPASINIHLHKVVLNPIPNRLPRIFVTFDDSSDEHYDEAFSYMDSIGIPGTIFTIYGSLGTAGKMTAAEVVEVHNAGWAIGYHGEDNFNNFSEMTEAEIQTSINNWFSFCSSNNLSRGIYTGAFPQSVHTQAIRQQLYDNGFYAFRCGRSWDEDLTMPYLGVGYTINQAGGFGECDPLQIPGVFNLNSADSGVTDQMTNVLTRAVDTHTDQVIAYHGIVPSGAAGTEVNRAQFRSDMDLLKTWVDAGLVTIHTFEEVISLQSQFNAITEDIVEDIAT